MLKSKNIIHNFKPFVHWLGCHAWMNNISSCFLWITHQIPKKKKLKKEDKKLYESSAKQGINNNTIDNLYLSANNSRKQDCYKVRIKRESNENKLPLNYKSQVLKESNVKLLGKLWLSKTRSNNSKSKRPNLYKVFDTKFGYPFLKRKRERKELKSNFCSDQRNEIKWNLVIARYTEKKAKAPLFWQQVFSWIDW